MRRSLSPALAAALLPLLAACGGDGTGSGRVPTTLRLDRSTVSLTEGDTTRLAATVLDQDGQAMAEFPSGSTLQWSSSSDAVATTEPDASGKTARVRSQGPGAARVRVRFGTLADSAAVTVAAQATALQRVSAEQTAGSSGAVLADSLAVRVVDRRGAGVPGVSVAFVVTAGGGAVSPATAATNAEGYAKTAWTLGPNAGENTVEARATLAGGPAALAFRASAVLGPVATITAITPAVLVPGGAATIQGTNFAATPAGNVVLVGGQAATVNAASATELSITLPSAFPCAPTRPVVVSVGGVTRAHPLRAGTPRELAPGAGVALFSAGEALCSELPAGRYVVSVFNSATAASSSAAFRLQGAGSTPAAASATAARAPVSLAAAGEIARQRRADGVHQRVLDANRRLVQRLGRPQWGRGGAAGPRRSVSADVPAVGATVQLRIPDIDADNLCTSNIPVNARVVYVGERTVMLEDAAAPLAGQMDELYRQAGQEVDGRMFEILRANFGDPLAYDSQLDRDGRIYMLFSPVINDFEGPLGFITAADFFPRAQCAGSNEREIFYALVPTTATGTGSSSPAGWFRTMRSTMIHETKHLASYAERFARNASVFEESWLEESTARISEEIWQRGYYPGQQRANNAYDPAVRCNVVPTAAGCQGLPLAMQKHFGALHTYLRQPEAQSPLGGTSVGSSSWYGSGWSLVRWAADHSAMTEADFFRALTQETGLRGVANLEARTGRPFREMLGEWAVAMATDDRPGFTPANPRHRFPSWNLRDVFAGMNADFASAYSPAYPLTPAPLPAGEFAVEMPGLRAGSASTFELLNTGTRPVVGLRGSGGAELAPTLHLSIVRVQ